jgi:hypothetical protein
MERPGNGRLRETVEPSRGSTKGRAFSPQRSALLIAVVVVVVAGGCGSSSSSAPRVTPDSSQTSVQRQMSTAEWMDYARRAEAICDRSIRETRALGRQLSEVVSHATTPLEGINNGLIRPGIEILSREANNLRALGTQTRSRSLEVFLGLFDPIVELARQRLGTGVSGDPGQAHSLELMIADLENEQSAAARQLGLSKCGVTFNSALGRSG